MYKIKLDILKKRNLLDKVIKSELNRKIFVSLVILIPVIIAVCIGISSSYIFSVNATNDNLDREKNNQYICNQAYTPNINKNKNSISNEGDQEIGSMYNLILAPSGMLLDLEGQVAELKAGEKYTVDISRLRACMQGEYALYNSDELTVSFIQPEDITRIDDDGGPKEGRIAPTPDESNNKYKVKKKIIVPVTAYASKKEQTDDTPFITAFNTNVYWGVVAANFLPYGTKLRIPAYYGDKVFTVEDRMNERYAYRIDIWMRTNEEAKNFGIRNTKVEILRRVK